MVEVLRRLEYLPEADACLYPAYRPLSDLRQAQERQTVLTGIAVRCDNRRDLWVSVGGYEGIIPREEVVHPKISGAQRDIAALSLVGRQVSFLITDIQIDGAGRPRLILSRRAAQERAFSWLAHHAPVGSVLPTRVTHLANFGAFVDLGCGVISLVPLENLSVARAQHPSQRLREGQQILVVVTRIDRDAMRIYLSHKELLGTWLENAAAFSPGDTVTGIVRGVMPYGIFIELTPNLSGLAQPREKLSPGDAVTVYIRSIRPESHKIKLQIIGKQDTPLPMKPPRYFITDGNVSDWVY